MNKKILIILPGGIGNMLMFTPALESLHNKFEHHKISLLTTKQKADLVVKKCPFIENIYIIKTISELPNLLIKLRKEKFEFVVSSMGTSSFKTGLISWLSGAKKRLGEDSFFYNLKVNADSGEHETNRNLKIISKIVEHEYITKQLSIYTDENDKKFSDNFIVSLNKENYNKRIGIHPGCGENMKEKRWPLNNFIKLINFLLAKNNKIILFGGTNEKELGEKIISSTDNRNIHSVIGKTTLTQTAEILRQCDLLISNDSGIMHLAAAVDTFVVAIFGPTIISKNKPYTDKKIIITNNTECSPCYSINNKIECDYDFKCLKELKVEYVIERISELI